MQKRLISYFIGTNYLNTIKLSIETLVGKTSAA